MSWFGKLYRGDTHIDFVGNRNRWFTISAIAIAVSIFSLVFLRLDLGVDFIGGSLVETENPNAATVADVRAAVEDAGFVGAKVQLTGGGDGIRVQTQQLEVADEDRLAEAVAAVAGVDPSEASRQTVGPTFGAQVTQSAIRALIIFLAVVALYITWRLEWKMAVAALVALVHDLTLTAGIYALLGFEVTPATVIAILTILGYSLYDTVVVFDKVLENVHDGGDKQTYSALVNMSMNQVLMRSINTSLTSLLPIGSLLFVGSFVLGATTLREFALALFIGVATGTYSSIFVASPFLAWWKEKDEHWKQVRRRLARRGGEDEYSAALDMPVDDAVDSAGVVVSGAVPRPPKRRRKRR